MLRGNERWIKIGGKWIGTAFSPLAQPLFNPLRFGRFRFGRLPLGPACLCSLPRNLTSASLREPIRTGSPSNESALSTDVAALLGAENFGTPLAAKAT
jgi:hypothetical protein